MPQNTLCLVPGWADAERTQALFLLLNDDWLQASNVLSSALHVQMAPSGCLFVRLRSSVFPKCLAGEHPRGASCPKMPVLSTSSGIDMMAKRVPTMLRLSVGFKSEGSEGTAAA
jgi:hypothetical protein